MSGVEISPTQECLVSRVSDLNFCYETGLVYPDTAEVERKLINRQDAIGRLPCDFTKCPNSCMIKVEAPNRLRPASAANEIVQYCMIEAGRTDPTL
jgi:hypothetical protein